MALDLTKVYYDKLPQRATQVLPSLRTVQIRTQIRGLGVATDRSVVYSLVARCSQTPPSGLGLLSLPRSYCDNIAKPEVESRYQRILSSTIILERRCIYSIAFVNILSLL